MPRDLRSLHPVIRLRWIMVRHRWIRWSAIAMCSITAGVGVQAKVAALDEARSEWDGGVEVLVLRHDVETGAEISAADVDTRFIAPNLVPDSAVDDVTKPLVARHPLGRGEILVDTHLGRRSGPAGLLEPGKVGVSIPLQEGFAPSLAVGDHVGVVVGPDPLAISDQPAAADLGPSATVISVTPEAILVAVDTTEAVEVATAASGGRVTLVLLESSTNPVRSPG
jgi:Flp pilus assembly protein CpaB